jgi:hypothetical protein
MRLIALMAALLAIAGEGAAAPPQHPFDPRDYQSKVAGQLTQILVLGSMHLSGTPENWDPSVLEPVLTKLAAFRPNVIAIEAQSGQSLSKLWQYREIYGDTATTYGARIMIMAAAGSVGTNMDMPQAEAEARRQLLAWPVSPTPGQRRHLAALFATAGDPFSALVQWWRLDSAERKAGDGITATLAAQLDELGRRRNEDNLIGSRLAARLGLERLYPMDAQDDDTFTPQQSEEFSKTVFPSLMGPFNANPRLRAVSELVQHLGTGEETLAAYRLANAPETGHQQADVEWLGVIDRPIVHDVGRIRMGGWEVRNLRMAANIREAASRVPGGRVLVIVGAGHKPWLQAYLSMMADVKIVDAEEVLR